MLRKAHILRHHFPMTHATLYRMKTDEHICPFGLKSRDLLEREGFEVTMRMLRWAVHGARSAAAYAGAARPFDAWVQESEVSLREALLR